MALVAHRAELVAQNDRFAKLLADLTEGFRRVQEQQAAHARELAAPMSSEESKSHPHARAQRTR